MLSMIPGFTGAEYKSNAEKKVFRLLQEANIEAGYAFHSVGLPIHERKSYSEADFIVVTPRGIVCLEVKGGSVECKNGVWSFQNRFGEVNYKNEGPFGQASGAMFALKAALVKRLPWVDNVSFATGVIFTDITFSYRGVSVIPEIIYDFSSRKSMSEYIDDIHAYWDSRKHRRIYSVLSQEEMDEIKVAIRDDLHFVPSLQTISNAVDEQLIRLTEEQIKTMNLLSENDKILVSGPAGSGKTLLAIEYAKRKAKEGKRVLYLTYNKGIASYLSALDIPSSIAVKTLHGLISDYIPLNPERKQDPQYYSTILPEQFAKYLSSHNLAAYDVLVVDEGQDLINTRYFPIFDKLVKRGLYNGSWAVFYDPNQNIFNKIKFDKSLNELLRNRPARCKLTKNCRNTEQIANFTFYCSAINPGEAHVSGDRVCFIPYDKSNLDEKFDELIDKIVKEGISKDKIKIISTVKMTNSVMANYTGQFKDSIESFNPIVSSDKLQCTTIQAFKGLDSMVVIATDITDLDDKLLLYTLFTRARVLLYLFVPQDVSISIQEKIIDSV
ncbi:MAG: NERD domain-containing protein [Clostridia bacterium]|nr:NERD domain-containing protein [Clostridia bacterium]